MSSFLKSLRNLGKNYGKHFLLMFFGLLLLLTGILALRLLLPGAKTESPLPEEVEVNLFDSKITYTRQQMLREGKVMAEFGGIARACGFHIGGTPTRVTVSTDGGDRMEITDGAYFVTVNGTRLSLETYASVSAEEIWLPLSFLERYLTGIDFTWNTDSSALAISRQTGSGATLSFLLKADTQPGKISSAGLRLQYQTAEGELDYEFAIDISPYLAYLNPVNTRDCLLFFTPTSPCGADYVPSALTAVKSAPKNQSLQLSEWAEKSLEAMLAEMNAAGIGGVKAVHAYMSYANQKKNYDNRVYNERYNYRYHPESEGTYFTDLAYEVLGKEYLQSVYISQGKYVLSQEDAERVASKKVAAPGTSDHQTGLGVDLSLSNSADKGFSETDAYRWLKENAYKFGFIERYPLEAEKMTGFAYEPYHWRFVGQYHAAAMRNGSFSCLEEYMAALGLD